MEFFTSCIQIIIITSKKHLLLLFFYSCLQYIYYLFVQYYFQTINCIKAFCRKEKLIQLSFMLGSCQTVFFNIKSNGLCSFFNFSLTAQTSDDFLDEKKCPSLQYMYVSHSHRFILCQKSEMKLNSILLIVICLLCTQGYFYIF